VKQSGCKGVTAPFLLALAGTSVFVAATVSWAIEVAAQRPLDGKRMQIDLSDFGSYAAEGALLASNRSSATEPYASAHSELWRAKILELAQKYHSLEAESQLMQRYLQVRDLGDRLLAVAEDFPHSRSGERIPVGHIQELKHLQSEADLIKSQLSADMDHQQ
jgi:hypothetical protein